MSSATPVVIAVLVAELIPAAAFGFAAERIAGAIGRLPFVARIVLPAVLVLPYVVIATYATHISVGLVCVIRVVAGCDGVAAGAGGAGGSGTTR